MCEPIYSRQNTIIVICWEVSEATTTNCCIKLPFSNDIAEKSASSLKHTESWDGDWSTLLDIALLIPSVFPTSDT